MKSIFIITILLATCFSSYTQTIDTLKFEKYEVNNRDTTFIFRLNGNFENLSEINLYSYFPLLFNRYGLYFKQLPAVSIHPDGSWHHYNIRMHKVYRDFIEIQMIKISKKDIRSLNFYQKLKTGGFSGDQMRRIREKIKMEVLPETYYIDFSGVTL